MMTSAASRVNMLLSSVLLAAWFKPVLLVELYHQENGSRWEIQGPASRYICSTAEESVKVGPGSLPDNVQYIQIENCGKVELETKLFNHIHKVVNITIRNIDSVILQPDLFESRGSGGISYSVETIELQNIRDLQVRRYAFRGLEVTNRFYLGEVKIAAVVPMSFAFDYVKEFSVFASKVDRISMWGIKLNRCGEFNILGMTHFASLAAHAIKARCDKFSMAYNWFGNVHDSSFEVEYGLCDIQGNTFVSLGGKPFLDLKPIDEDDLQGVTELAMSGFVFRENKFASDPVLPFGSLAMPSYDKISRDSSYVDIDSNQFPCECDAVGWLLAYGQHGYNSKSIAEIAKVKGGGSLNFLRQLYQSSGKCIVCTHSLCRSGAETLIDYAAKSLVVDSDILSCGSGVVIKNYDVTSAERDDMILMPKPWRDNKGVVSGVQGGGTAGVQGVVTGVQGGVTGVEEVGTGVEEVGTGVVEDAADTSKTPVPTHRPAKTTPAEQRRLPINQSNPTVQYNVYLLALACAGSKLVF